MELDIAQQQEISEIFHKFMVDLAVAAKKYQPGYEHSFYKICQANYVLLFSFAYQNNALDMLIELASMIVKMRHDPKGQEILSPEGVLTDDKQAKSDVQ